MGVCHRGAPQSANIVVRLTEADKAQLKLKAQAEATNVSAIIRTALLRQGLLQPVMRSDGKYW